MKNLICFNFLILLATASASESTTNMPFVARWKGNAKAAVSFTFDDGIRDQYTLALPWLTATGIKATFFVNGGPIDTQKPTRQGAPRMTWEMVKALSDAGHEVSSHGYDHRNHGKFPQDVIQADIETNDVVIAQHTGKKPTTYAYPNNTKRDWSGSVVNPGRVGSRLFQKSFGGSMTVERARKLFADAEKKGEWLVTMTHGIATGYDFWKDPAQLEACLKEAADDRELWIDTFANVAIYARLRDETKIDCIQSNGVWHITVTPPPLDPNLFTGTLDLVLPDGTIRPLNPYAGTLTIAK